MSLLKYLTNHIAVRYIISGGSAALVNLVSFSTLHYLLHVQPVAASISASLIAFAVSFLLQKYFTFRETHPVSAAQALRYAVVFFLNIGMTTGLFWIFLHIFSLAVLDQFLAIGLTALVSFFLYRAFVFRASAGDATPGTREARAPCPICGSSSGFYARKSGHDLWRCRSCAFMYVDPLPEIGELYSEGYFTGGSSNHGYTSYDVDKVPMIPAFHTYLDRIKELLPGTGKLLDVGAATGFFVDIATKEGFDAEGVEISAYAAASGRAKGLRILTGTLADISAQKTFDVITMFDVIEHVRDPRADLLHARARLRQGGLLVLNTPDAGSLYARVLGERWHLIVPPEHLDYFTRRAMRILLEQTGFETCVVTTIGKRFTLSYIFATLHRWQGLSVWAHAARFSARHLSRLAIPINVRDNMFVIARKR